MKENLAAVLHYLSTDHLFCCFYLCVRLHVLHTRLCSPILLYNACVESTGRFTLDHLRRHVMKVSGSHVQSVLKKMTGVNNLTFKNTFCCHSNTRTCAATISCARKQGYDGLSQINRPSQVKQQKTNRRSALPKKKYSYLQSSQMNRTTGECVPALMSSVRDSIPSDNYPAGKVCVFLFLEQTRLVMRSLSAVSTACSV